MVFRAIHGYVAIVCLLAVASLQLVPWHTLTFLQSSDILGFIVLIAFGLVSERLAVGISFASRGASHTITFIPLLATVVLFGPAAPVLFLVLTGTVAELFFRKKPPLRVIFNIAQYLLATSLAGWAFYSLGGSVSSNAPTFTIQLLPFAVFLLVLMGLNHTAVALAIATEQLLPFREVWARFVGPAGVNLLQDLLVSPLAFVVAFFYWTAGPVGLILSLLPLLFVRHAYLNSYRLVQANRDLLSVLVKAIETRDPYTSGHSQRVAQLAGQIARNLKLSTRHIETVEMAALLHDVGKIDAVYSEMLRKPDALTADERRLIESHVMKGVELLRSLASVPESVISAVHHHHEREDGEGYPDGLAGDTIPLAAKIIRVCDSIDAMLSDRPYRAALPLERVKEELQQGVGREFDAAIVSCVLDSGLLQDHLAALGDPQRRPRSVGINTIEGHYPTSVRSPTKTSAVHADLALDGYRQHSD